MKWLLRILIVLTVLIVAGYFVLQYLVERGIENGLTEADQEMRNSGAGTLKWEDVDVSILGGNVFIDGIRIVDNRNGQNIRVARLQIGGIDLGKDLGENQLPEDVFMEATGLKVLQVAVDPLMLFGYPSELTWKARVDLNYNPENRRLEIPLSLTPEGDGDVPGTATGYIHLINVPRNPEQIEQASLEGAEIAYEDQGLVERIDKFFSMIPGYGEAQVQWAADIRSDRNLPRTFKEPLIDFVGDSNRLTLSANPANPIPLARLQPFAKDSLNSAEVEALVSLLEATLQAN